MIAGHWPLHTLSAVPGESVARQLAEEVRQLAVDDTLRCDLEKLCLIGGFRYRSAVLDSRTGGHEALLVPRLEGGFEILVDPLPVTTRVGRQGSHERLMRRRVRFRIAHEIGHSFFYDRRHRPARRLLPTSEAEEVFCDFFASSLLLPQSAIDQAQPTSASIVKLANKFDVSVEAAGRALARSYLDISAVGLRPSQDLGKSKAFVVLWSTGKPLRAGRGNHIVLDANESDQSIKVGPDQAYRVMITKLGADYYVATLKPEKVTLRKV